MDGSVPTPSPSPDVSITSKALRSDSSATPPPRRPATGNPNLDFSLFRNFQLRERLNLRLRGEVFNLSNTPAFFLPSAASPVLTIGHANFGKRNVSASTGRQIQFGLKLLCCLTMGSFGPEKPCLRHLLMSYARDGLAVFRLHDL